MDISATSVRGIVIFGIASLILLAGCGGGVPTVNNQPPSVAPQPTGITVSPSNVTVQTGGAQPFAAVVNPSGANQAVTWSVSGAGCAGATCGTISSAGMYTAPASVPNSATVMVTATSVADSTKSASATVTIIAPAPPPLAPTLTLLIQATPPAGITVLSFSTTVTGAVLEPGGVPLVTNPVSVEINRLQFDASLLANLLIPLGTYNSLNIVFANPVLTILNSSGAAIGSCTSGAICKLNPTLAVSSVNLTGQPFPITYDGKTPLFLQLDFDLSKSLSSSNFGSLNPIITVQQILPTASDQGLFVKQVAGSIAYTGGDDLIDGAIFNLMTSTGTLYSVSDFFAQYVDARLCGYYFCVQDKIAEVDLTLPSRSDSVWEARRVTLKPPNQPELEGVIVAIGDTTQFDMVLLHQVPAAADLALGDIVHINLQSGTTIEAVDTNLTRSGLLFSAPPDLLVGQVVTVRAQSAPSGTPVAVTTDRVRLKSGALTARVKSVLNGTDFIVDNLPGNFPSGQIEVRTDAQTGFVGISGVSGLNAGDAVSLGGFLLKTASDPVLFAEGVRKR